MYYLVKPDNIDFIKETKSFQDGQAISLWCFLKLHLCDKE